MEMVELAPMTKRRTGRLISRQHESSSSSSYCRSRSKATDRPASHIIMCRRCRSNNASVHEEDCDACSCTLYLEGQDEVVIRGDPHDDTCTELQPIHDAQHHKLNPKQRGSSSTERQMQIVSTDWDSEHQDAFMNIIVERHDAMQTRSTIAESSMWADTGAFGLSEEIDCIKHEIDEIESRIEEIESSYMEDILTNRVPSLARTRICNTWRPHAH